MRRNYNGMLGDLVGLSTGLCDDQLVDYEICGPYTTISIRFAVLSAEKALILRSRRLNR